MKLFSIELRNNDQNYAYYMCWFLGRNIPNEFQINALISQVAGKNDNLSILSLDSEGELLEDYISDFDWFDINILSNGSSVIVEDINFADEVFLESEEGIVLIEADGEVSHISEE